MCHNSLNRELLEKGIYLRQQEDHKREMYALFLTLHSIFRWLVLATLLYALYRSYRGWFGNKIFTLFDDKVRHTTATISHIQLVIGVLLYFVSPVVDYFLHYFPSAIHERDIRFFGMEHSTMMFLAIVVITIGSSGAKRGQADKTKFKTIAITYTIGLLIIFFPFHGHFLVSPAGHTFAASNDYCYFFTPCQLVSSAL